MLSNSIINHLNKSISEVSFTKVTNTIELTVGDIMILTLSSIQLSLQNANSPYD